MQTIYVDGLSFAFPDSWKITKYDDWTFYKNQFMKMNDGIKAVDLAVFDDNNTLWLIEVKDFRQHRRQNTTPLHEIDPHPLVVSKATMPSGLQWSVH